MLRSMVPRVRGTVPRDRENDYTDAAARARREFVRERTGVALEHVGHYSVDPAATQGNIEHFAGVAQVPLGIAGPLLIDGGHAQREFYVPMATAEGTLVASTTAACACCTGGRRQDDRHGRQHAARAGVRVRERPRGARVRRLARRALRRDQGGGRDDDAHGPAARHRALLGRAPALHALQLHDRRRRGAEPHRQGDAGRVPVDPRQQRGGRALPARGRVRDRQEDVARQHAPHARQARGGRCGHPRRAPGVGHARLECADVPRPAALEPRRVHVRRQQQRRALGERHRRDVHRDRAGGRQPRRVVRRLHIRRAA
jgi:Hydroxymethylglutaryl-coenzyme A reductase